MPTITISTHNGSRVCLDHNVRKPEMVQAENIKWSLSHPGELRIDPDGEYIVWHSESLEEAYKKLFDEAVNEWNHKQDLHGTPERKINNYLSELRAKSSQSKNAKKPVYEIIYALGSKEHPVEETAAKAILKEMSDGFEKRNPNLYPICKVLHNDEVGVMHVHVTYIPVAKECSRGLRTQNSLTTALKQQGISGDAFSRTAQMAWERSENDYMESLCRKYGYDVIHPQRGEKQEHLSVEEYKLRKEIEELKREISELKNLPGGKAIIKKGRLKQLEDIEAKYLKAKSAIEKSGKDSVAAQDAMKAYTKAMGKLNADKNDFDKKVNDRANVKAKMMNADAMNYITQAGLVENFKVWKMAYYEIQKQQREAEEHRIY